MYVIFEYQDFMFWQYILLWAVYMLTFVIEGGIIYVWCKKQCTKYSPLHLAHDATDKADTILVQSLTTDIHVKWAIKLSPRKIFTVATGV